MNKHIKDLMLKSGYAYPELAPRAHNLCNSLVKDIMTVVAAHVLSGDTAADIFSNLKRIYEDQTPI